MPELITQNYYFGGWTEVLVYSEQDMADALGITVKELLDALKNGKLSCHAFPQSNALRQYQFNQSSFDDNILCWNCLKNGGHHFEFDHWYDHRINKATYKCTDCPREKYD